MVPPFTGIGSPIPLALRGSWEVLNGPRTTRSSAKYAKDGARYSSLSGSATSQTSLGAFHSSRKWHHDRPRSRRRGHES